MNPHRRRLLWSVLLLPAGPACSADGGAAAGPPLTLRLEAAAPQVAPGAAIVLRVAHHIHRRLEMETVELNRDRTRITVTPLGGAGATRVLTGADYVRQQQAGAAKEPNAVKGPDGPAMIGREFVAEAGDNWVSELNLSDFASPLPAGRYRIRLSYRWGAHEAQTVGTNSIDVVVVVPR